jgi:hypothetical protein|uniref:Uncharacterized protein n=1 Tax=Siphoviridae sp. ctGuJ10 TaxID=2825418 RepID=A0A8S5PUC5_9CAUD|nr:MAG TPA: hypothetical protein [Siphoviridae sp. ctGuJ10]
MSKKYTIQDLIVQKIIFAGTYTQSKTIAAKLHEYNIKTDVIDNMITIRDSKFYMLVDHGELTMIMSNSVRLFKDSYLLIDCNDIDIEYPTFDKEETEEFELEEIVHAVICDNEIFSFVRQHVTSIISAIDRKNRMCEVVYLNDVHHSEWVSFDNLHHIEHIYDTLDEYEESENEEQ